jgi:hypothetical protein
MADANRLPVLDESGRRQMGEVFLARIERVLEQQRRQAELIQ